MLEAVRIPVAVGPDHLVVTASVGVVTPTSAQDRPQDLLRAADAAMYQAKQAGRGRFVHRRRDGGAGQRRGEDAERRALETEVGRALDRHELVLHYQPIVAMDGAVLEIEALLRWRHPSAGCCCPRSSSPSRDSRRSPSR